MSKPDSRILNILRETVRETFETLAFSELSSWEMTDSRPDSTGNWIRATIPIHRPFTCRFSLFLQSDQCLEFVEAAYGSETLGDPEVERILADYIGELVNTIAGRFAASFASQDGDIELGLPQPEGIPESTEKQTGISFSLDGVTAWCFLDDFSCRE